MRCGFVAGFVVRGECGERDGVAVGGEGSLEIRRGLDSVGGGVGDADTDEVSGAEESLGVCVLSGFRAKFLGRRVGFG